MGPAGEADDTEQTQEPFSSSEDEAPADPDSDIPDELQVILSSSCSTRSLDDTLSIPQPPESPLSDHLSLPVTTSDSNSSPGSLPGPHMREDDTGKKSFDFTGELNRLNQGGVRLSFVEQLEEAFKTPQVFLSDSGSASESRAISPVSLDWELPVEPKANLNRTGELNGGFQFGKPTTPLNIAVPPMKGLHSRTNTETSNLSAREIELLEDLDASMERCISLESDTESKREARFSVTYCASSHSGHSRGESVMSISSLGSIIDSGVSDPFGYWDEIAGPQIPLPPAPSLGHSHSDSLASIPSMSSLGRIIKPADAIPSATRPLITVIREASLKLPTSL
ncbi:uncharacterized protein EI90DRAFT_3118188 [Cantharellus anzutake]|uniref:uncharacterized protein n=1 Tax=Cantharellus anzutake TaxID=1750568 RepID=UPI001906B713|nr:uncharacterized protein EI90DRAFT_3118188 [Cantharellus anzutake]KAF8339103.1 hypothetical protein EI90DRAFT_3118188 [Cantharellus anzutake]